MAGQSAQWNRGAYLVNGLGHCGACHTPRDAQGAERQDRHYLGGALVRGWEAPALGALAQGALPWTEAAMVQYLRTGAHPHHGIAGGPMAEAVRGLAALPDGDLRAIAHYLVALQGARGLPAAADGQAGPQEGAVQALAAERVRVAAGARAAAGAGVAFVRVGLRRLPSRWRRAAAAGPEPAAGAECQPAQ